MTQHNDNNTTDSLAVDSVSAGSDLCVKCPECECLETVEECDNSLAEGYRVCANPKCHQEWYVDIDYTQNV